MLGLDPLGDDLGIRIGYQRFYTYRRMDIGVE